MAIQQTIRVTADTSQAKTSLQALQSQLQALQSIPITADVTGLQSARSEINQLSQSLRTAINPNTGKLDLSVFSNQLTKTGKSLIDYKNALFSMGTEGQQAFLSLANAIASAEAPTNRLNQKILNFGKTLKNTINWQISSSLVHGVVGSFQKAINYAEKLNQSLNNIQIVTGQNNEKMAEFARQANQTAKRLSTTTTEYTNASLIYYQQGLSDKEVAARTETTVKLANVTRQSAQTVSDQMTAIWNNYAEGSANLEHYADVITALGAATASSSAEIAGGLEKFAAVSKTVGLSYNYATTALATIVATTRQSEDTVGTGLRTIFSRLESLKLGATLEDGVGLTKYTAALKSAGVEVLDQFGKVKDMDQILEELGAKWQTISREQQIALAQTVGGVRQYTNLMALMNNWGKFQQNLKIAEGADGTLEEQSERYASSWEAARKRVQTSAEGMYDSLIDDQAIIKVTNVFAGFLDVINGLVAGFGGLKGLIPVVGALLLNSFSRNMPTFLKDIGANFSNLTGRSEKNMLGTQSVLSTELRKLQSTYAPDSIEALQLQKIIDKNNMSQMLIRNSRYMSDAAQADYRDKILARELQTEARIAAKQQQVDIQTAYDRMSSHFKGPAAGVDATIKEAEKTKNADIKEAEKAKKAAEREADKAEKTAKAASSFDAEAYRKSLRDTKLKDIQDAHLKELYTQESHQKSAVTKARNAVADETKQKELINAKRQQADAEQALATRKQQDDYIQRERELKRLTQQSSNATSTAERTRLRGLIDATKRDLSGMTADQDRALAKAKERVLNATKAINTAKESAKRAEEKYDERKKASTEYEDELIKKEKERIKTVAEEERKQQQTTIEEKYTADKAAAEKAFEDTKHNAAKTKDEALNALYNANEDKELDAKYKDLLKGKALTKENLEAAYKERNQGEQLTGSDLKAIENANKAYMKPLFNASAQHAALSEAKAGLGTFEETLKDINDPETLRQRVQEFQESWNQAVQENGASGKTKLDIGDLLGLSPDAIRAKVSEAIKIAKETINSDITQKGEDISSAEKNLSKGGVSAEEQKRVMEAGEAKGKADYSASMIPGQKPAEEPGQKVPLSTALTQAASAATTLYSAFQAASNAVQTFADDSATGLSKFGAALSAITTGLMSSGMVGNALTSIFGKNSPISAYAGYIGIAISLVTSLVGLAKGAEEARRKEIDTAQKEIIQSGKDSIERLDNSAELKSSQENLINAYDKTAADLKKGASTQQALVSAQQELIAALQEATDGYSNKSAVAAILKGDTKTAQRILDDNRLIQLAQEEQTILQGQSAAGRRLQNAVSNAGLDRNFQLKGMGSTKVNDIFRQYADTGFINVGADELKHYESESMGAYDLLEPGAITLANMHGAEPEKIYEYVKTLKNIYSDIVDAGLENTDQARNLKSQIDIYKDVFDDYEQFHDVIQNNEIEKLILGGRSSTGTIVGRANEQITDIQSYKNYRDNLIAAVKEANKEALDAGTVSLDELVSGIDTALGLTAAVTNNELGNLQYIYQGIEGVIEYQQKMRQARGENQLTEKEQADMTNNLAQWYKEYGQAVFDLGMTVTIPTTLDENTSEFQTYLKMLQAVADDNKIEIQLELASGFKLDSSSTAAEWAAFKKDLDKDLWKSIIGEDFDLATFTSLPKEIQTALLNKYYAGLSNKKYENNGTVDTRIESAQTRLMELQGEGQDSVQTAEQIKNQAWSSVYDKLGLDDNSALQKSTQTFLDVYGEDTKKYLNGEMDAKAAAEFEKRLQANGLQNAITKDNKEALESYIDANTRYNSLLTEQSSLEETITDLQAEKQIWQDIGFRKVLQNEAEEWNINYNKVQEYATALREAGVFIAQDIRGSEEFALAVLKQSAALDTFSSKQAEWLKTFEKFDEHSDEFKNASKEMADAFRQLLGLSKKDFLSPALIEWGKKTGNLKKLVDGNKDAWAEVFALQAKGFTKSAKLADDLSDDIDKFTKKMADKKTGEIISQDEVKEAKDIVKQVAQAREAAGDAMSAQEQGDLFKSLTNTEGDFFFDQDGTLVRTVKLEIAEPTQADYDVLQGVLDSIPEGETIDLKINQEDEISTVKLPANSTINADGTITYDDPVNGPQTVDVSGGYSIDGTIPNPIVKSKGTGGGHAGGGGGGGGKKEPHKPKRYRNIENQIQNNKRKTDATSRDKDRAVGTAKLEYLEKERALREENLKLEQQYQKEIEDWLDKDRDKMMEAFAAINFTPIFDEAGEVINNDEFELAFEAIGDGSNEAWKKAEEALAQYEETLDKLNDKLEEIKEIQQTIFDSLLEEVELKVTLKLDVSNDRLEYIDYLLTKIDDDAYQAAEAIALLGEKTGETMAQAATYASGIEEILSHHKLPDGTTLSLENIGNVSTEDLLAANFTQDEIDKIREWRSSLLQANESLLEMRKTITDKLISAFEDLNEKVQRSYELFDHYNTTLEHYKNITDLIAKGNSSFQSRAALEALNRSSFTNSVNQLTAAKRILDDMPRYLAEAEQQYQDALASGDRNRIVQAERYLQTIQDREQEAREQWEEAWESSLESAQSFFEFTMENIAKDYEDTMSGMFGTLDYLQQAYERHKEDAEWYLESYDSLYQLGKLSRDISRAIDDTDSIRIKQRYRDLQAEINKLQKENAQLTQHDVDMLQREFELELARAALEEAKNAKTRVRLQRDSEGNWGYVYTADEDKVNDALDKYAEALHAFQQTNHEYFAKIQDDFMNLLDVGTQITDMMSDLDLTPEEALANIEDLMQSVLGDDGRLQRLLDDLKQANADEEKIRELFTEIYGEDAVNNWLTFDDTLLKDLLNVDNIEDLRNLLTEAYEAAIQAGKEAREQLATDVGTVGDAAGVSVEDFGDHVHGLVQHLDAESLAAIQSVDDLATAMNTTFAQAMQQALQWEKDYADQMATVIAQNEAFVTSIDEMIEALSGMNGIEFYTRVNGITGSAGQAKFESFDSGGYTGIWGTHGRLAVLHEKEQIFNQDDTARLFNAAQILRTLDMQAMLASQGLGKLLLPTLGHGLSQTVDQNVTITAEFPNATNHSEIEEAFNNLINKASQYANRRTI